MPQKRRIYLLDPKKLSPETIAVTFAKTSRSPKSFDEIAVELSEEHSANFHEKWVVGYGHSSVAEHAVLHIAVENISRLAIECLESNRLASYTEKSSRYQVWDADTFYLPEEFNSCSTKDLYIETCENLFTAYETAFNQVSTFLKKNEPQQAKESNRGYETRLRSTCADVCRYLLPASSLANVGISINARALEHALCKMLSHPLKEVHEIGKEIKEKALENVPTLVKYANPKPYLKQLSLNNFDTSDKPPIGNRKKDKWCECVNFDADGIEKIMAAFIYRFGNSSYKDNYKNVSLMDSNEKNELISLMFKGIEKHDIPIRELEYAQISFDIILDQGAYFEMKRHRMMTQTVQPFTPNLGYAIPSLITKAGVSELFVNLMQEAEAAFEQFVSISPHAAAYVLPNAFNRRVLMKMNLRSAYHLIKLRCAPNAHFAIRRPTLRIAGILCEKYPLFESIFSPCTDESWQSVEENCFSQTS